MAKSKLNEYTFDVKLAAVARIKSRNEKEAITLLHQTIQAVRLGFEEGPVRLTEASVDDCSPRLLEVNGREIEDN